MSTKFGLLIDFELLNAAISTNAKPEIVFSVRSRHLDKAIWRYISAVAAPIWTKFGRLMQNKMQITGKWSRSEPEVEFQYGGCLFFQTRSRYAAIDLLCWPLMSTKFGLLTDFGLLKARTSTNTKPEVVLSERGRHLEKSIWRHISAVAVDPECHDNNGDEVKLETEKTNTLKARHYSLVRVDPDVMPM